MPGMYAKKTKGISKTTFINSKEILDSWLRPKTAFLCLVRSAVDMTDTEIEQIRGELLSLITSSINLYPEMLLTSDCRNPESYFVNLNMFTTEEKIKFVKSMSEEEVAITTTVMKIFPTIVNPSKIRSAANLMPVKKEIKKQQYMKNFNKIHSSDKKPSTDNYAESQSESMAPRTSTITNTLEDVALSSLLRQPNSENDTPSITTNIMKNCTETTPATLTVRSKSMKGRSKKERIALCEAMETSSVNKVNSKIADFIF